MVQSSTALLNHIVFFFFNDTATTEIYTLSLHDALPIWFERVSAPRELPAVPADGPEPTRGARPHRARPGHRSGVAGVGRDAAARVGLSRAAPRVAGASRARAGPLEPQEHDGPPRHLHAGHHRCDPALRRGPRGVSRAPLSRGLAAVLPDPRARRRLAESAPPAFRSDRDRRRRADTDLSPNAAPLRRRRPPDPSRARRRQRWPVYGRRPLRTADRLYHRLPRPAEPAGRGLEPGRPLRPGRVLGADQVGRP